MRPLQGAFGRAQGSHGELRDLARLGQGGVEQLGIREGARGDAGLDRAHRVDPLRGVEQLRCALLADAGL